MEFVAVTLVVELIVELIVLEIVLLIVILIVADIDIVTVEDNEDVGVVVNCPNTKLRRVKKIKVKVNFFIIFQVVLCFFLVFYFVKAQ